MFETDPSTPNPGDSSARDSSVSGGPPGENAVTRRRAQAARRLEVLDRVAQRCADAVDALARQAEVAARLAEIQLAQAERYQRRCAEAEAAADPEPVSPPRPLAPLPNCPPDLGRSIDRAARAVRLTIMLRERLTRGTAREAREAGRKGLRELSDAGDPKLTEVAQTLLKVIAAEPDDRDGVDRLLREAWERLEDEDILEDLANRPAADIVTRVCRDIGVTSEWSKWSLELHGIDLDAAPTITPGSHTPESWLREMPPGVRRPPEELAAAVAAGYGPSRRAGPTPSPAPRTSNARPRGP